MRTFAWLGAALALPFIAASCATEAPKEPPYEPPSSCCVPPPDHFPKWTSKPLGFIEKPAEVGGRDGAQSAAIGGALLWIFGDTFFGKKSVDGVHYRTNTAAIASVADPLMTSEPLDDNGAPFAALAWTEGELAYNEAAEEGSDRVALWNAGLVADEEEGTLLAFYEKLYTKPSGWEAAGIGTARFRPGETTGERAEGLLFDWEQKEEPLFKHAMLHEGTVYLYGAKPGLPIGYVARAPLFRAEERSAYTFWDGEGWSADVEKAAPLSMHAPGDMSVAYNAYLERFVAISSQPLDTRVMIRVAARPEGPWSESRVLFETDKGADGAPTYVGTQHPALERDGGRTIVVSYSLPTDCFLCGEVALVEVTFE